MFAVSGSKSATPPKCQAHIGRLTSLTDSWLGTTRRRQHGTAGSTPHKRNHGLTCEQCKKTNGWLFDIGDEILTQLYGDCFINHEIKVIKPTRIQWKVGCFFFLGSFDGETFGDVVYLEDYFST